MLRRVKIPEIEDTLSLSLNEDKDLYTRVGGRTLGVVGQDELESRGTYEYKTKPEQVGTLSVYTSLGGVEEEPSEYRLDPPTIGTLLDLYLTPEQTLLLPLVVLLTVTIRGSTSNELEEV